MATAHTERSGTGGPRKGGGKDTGEGKGGGGFLDMVERVGNRIPHPFWLFLGLAPLAAMAFLAVGRSPLVGIGLGFASVSAGFNASLVINATDPLLAGISTTGAQLIDEDYVVSPLANIYFTVLSSFVIALIITVVFERWISPRMEGMELDGDEAPEDDADTDAEDDAADESGRGGRADGDEDGADGDEVTEFASLEDASLEDTEKKGLRNSLLAGLAFLVLLAAATAIPGSPLRGPEGEILTGPAIMSVSILIALLFVVMGVAYGLTAKTITSWADVPTFMTRGMKDLAPVLVLFFAAAQFITWFDWSNMGTVLAVSGADVIESLGVPALVVILLVILMTYGLNLFITSGSAQWTLMAPVIVPALMLLGISPEVSQMGFRIGDSASNIITPLNVYFALMLTYLQRYRKDAGIGTLMSMTLPASVAILIGWTAFFCLWYAVGLPLGPGVPVR